MHRHLLAVALALACGPGFAAIRTAPLEWKVGDETFSGHVVYDDAAKEKRPGLVMFPNWMGVNDVALERAKAVADDGYVVLLADVYGKGVRPKDARQAGATVGKAFDDGGTRLRARANAAVAALKAQAGNVPLDASRIGAFGFCFGGSVALELARSGADVAGVVSFHGGLKRHVPADGPLRAPVLVLNGADDSAVPEADILAFRKEMKEARADWQFVDFGGAVHCFTQPESASPPNCVYDARASNRAFEMMEDFFEERFEAQ